MALKIYDTLAPQGDYPAVKAESVEMPDGTRLSQFKGGVTSVNGQTGDVIVPAGEKGEKGDKGDKGDPGATGATGPIGNPGSDGKDGVSPTVSVTAITGGHRVTITDATGTKTFDVMDGEDGQGASITVDSALSTTSTNPIQNKAVAQRLSELTEAFSESLENVAEMIPGLDDTLSEEGKAADAKAVGDAFTQATNDINQAFAVVMPKLLPSVTTSDNGKFLRVENGAWAKVSIDNAEGVGF